MISFLCVERVDFLPAFTTDASVQTETVIIMQHVNKISTEAVIQRYTPTEKALLKFQKIHRKTPVPESLF